LIRICSFLVSLTFACAIPFFLSTSIHSLLISPPFPLLSVFPLHARPVLAIKVQAIRPLHPSDTPSTHHHSIPIDRSVVFDTNPFDSTSALTPTLSVVIFSSFFSGPHTPKHKRESILLPFLIFSPLHRTTTHRQNRQRTGQRLSLSFLFRLTILLSVLRSQT